MEVRIVEGEALALELDSLCASIAEVASDGFGAPGFIPPERIRHMLERDPSVTLAEDGDGLLGFQIQGVDKTEQDDFLYYSRAMRQRAQGRGLGQVLLGAAIDHYRPSVVGARSQNPAEVRSFIRAMEAHGVAAVYPFAQGPEATNLLPTVATFIAVRGLVNVELHTGLARNSYGQGRLGHYVINTSYSGVRAIEAYLQSIGFDRDGGDALFYCARLPAAAA